MKRPRKDENWFFVDETGDPTFYDHAGKLIVGEQGCSPILGLGFVETSEPRTIRRTLSDLHSRIEADTYLQRIPSMTKTNRAFHAKDDAPEVR